MLARISAVLAAVAVTLGISLAVAPPAGADDSFTVGAVTNNCGIVTCSVYISRSGTKSLDRFMDNKIAQYGSAAAQEAVCGEVGKVPYVGLAFEKFCEFRFDQFDQALDEAADKNKCFKVTYIPPPAPVVTHISTNNGKYCED